MKFAQHSASHSLIIGMAAVLAACGGGGGGASGTTGNSFAASSITSANMQDVGAQGYSATSNLNAQVGGSTSGFITDVSVEAAAAGIPGAALQGLYRALQAQAGASQVVGITVTETIPCAAGGSMAVTATIASAGAISAGDNFAINASACKEPRFTLNGKFNVTFKSLSGEPGQSAWSGALAIAYTDFSVSGGGAATASATGDMSINVNQTAFGAASFAVTGKSLKLDAAHNGATDTVTLSNFSYGGSLKSGTYTYNANFGLTGNLSKLGDVNLAVKTLTDFKQTGLSFPYQGVLKVTATDNSSVTLTVVNNSSVTLDLDKNGDGAIDETVNTTWTALASRL
ncbi:MAG TPA: hypothetical protein VEC06_19055 [Paucimonas sp.]|nr:hypothetical protein [Paucimonas sp.]